MSSLTTTDSRITFVGDAVVSTFNTGFWVQNAADLVVYKRVDSTDVDTLQVLDTDYTVTDLDNFNGSNINMVDGGVADPVPSGTTLIIYRDPPETNSEDLSNTSSLFPVAITRALDYLTALVQGTRLRQARTIRLPSRHGLTLNPIELTSDASSSLASKFLAFKADGVTPIPATTVTTPPVTAFMETLLDDSAALEARTTLKVGVIGADVASAAALPVLADGDYINVTGVAAITSIDTVGIGSEITIRFVGVLVFTHHATNLILPTGANITTAAGDHAVLREYATGDWRCTNYQRADGTALA